MTKGIHKVTVRLADGKTKIYIYAWRGGIRLISTPNTDEFSIEYAAALQKRRDSRNPKLTLKRLIADYRGDECFRSLSTGTRRYRNLYFTEIIERFGTMSFAALEDKGCRKHFKNWRDEYTATPKGADLRMETLRCVLTFGVDQGDIGVNRAKGLPSIYRVDRSDIIWMENEIVSLKQASPEPVRRVIDLARLTGLRKGCLIALPWSAIQDDRIVWKPLKTRHLKRPPTVYIPILPELKALFAQWPVEATTILTNAHKASWKSNALQNAFSRTKAKATKNNNEMDFDKHFHDFRGTYATYLMRAGLDNEKVAFIMGWGESTITQIRRRYVADSAVMDAVIRQLTVKDIVKRS